MGATADGEERGCITRLSLSQFAAPTTHPKLKPYDGGGHARTQRALRACHGRKGVSAAIDIALDFGSCRVPSRIRGTY